MKRRSGFVSNSSSSSFIFIFRDGKPTAESLGKLIGSAAEYHWSGKSERIYDSGEIGKFMFNSLSGSASTLPEIKEHLSEFYNIDDEPDDSPDRYSWKLTTEQHKEETIKFSKKLVDLTKVFFDKNGFIYIVEFEDDAGGIERLVECGEYFSKIEHLKNSHH